MKSDGSENETEEWDELASALLIEAETTENATTEDDEQDENSIVYCHDCGKPILDTDMYCRKCGSRQHE